MAINPIELAAHIADYNQVFDASASRFVCPILGRECDEAELMNGHILNQALEYVPLKTVIQYKDIDGFYGSCTEAEFIRYVNSPFLPDFDVIKSDAEEIKVKLGDGSVIDAFYTEGNAAQAASAVFPGVEYSEGEKALLKLILKTQRNDPRLKKPENDLAKTGIQFRQSYTCAHWVATMWKAAYLADFSIRGYAVMNDPDRVPVRERLVAYYLANGKKNDVAKYFDEFRHAVKIVVMKGADGNFEPVGNTLADGRILFHYTPTHFVFAASYIFPIRNLSFSVTIPQGLSSEYSLMAMEFYKTFVTDEEPLSHYYGFVKWDGKQWVPDGEKFPAEFPRAPPEEVVAAMNNIVISTPPKKK